MQSHTITLFDTTIRQDADGRFCLNDLHKAAMANGQAQKDHNPARFLRNDGVKEFVSLLELESQNPPIKIVKGRGITGTYATELVALRYAGWISARVEVEVYKTFQKVAQADEALTHDMLERQRDPEASKRLAVRAQSKVIRNNFTDGLKEHGVTGKGYALCTNAIYEPLFGTNAKGLLALKNLPQSSNAREAMDRRELVAVMFAEEVALARIEREDARGNNECIQHSYTAATETKRVLNSNK
jgi:hypothetical protein